MTGPDARHLPVSLPAHADVVVIGGGHAGLTVAAELAAADRTVVVLESGPDAEHLNRIESTGARRVEPQSLVRPRRPGGSSTIWSGRCTPLDEIDLRERPWIPHSGWPLTLEQLAPDLARAAQLLGLGEQEYGDGVWPLLGIPAPRAEPDRRRLLPRFWQFSRGRTAPWGPFRAQDDAVGGYTMYERATVVAIEHEGPRAVAVRVAVDGGLHRVAAGAVVVAAGAIETPRLLLASGLGNDWVGRCLMDHPGVAIARIPHAGAAAVRDRFGLYWRPDSPARLAYLAGLALAPEVQREERLLNAACWLDEFPALDDPWQAGIRIVARLRGARTGAHAESVEFWRTRDGSAARTPTLLGDLGAVLRHPVLIARGLARLRRNRPPLYRAERVDLYALVEQPPDPDSRVSLADEHDDHGVPLPRVHWVLHDAEYETMRRLLELVREELPRMGLPAPEPTPWMARVEDWRTHVLDRAHQLGTARMGADETQGATDVHGRLFGTDNVHVAGGALFPTSGHANPTLTLVALSLRVARHVAAVTPVR